MNDEVMQWLTAAEQRAFKSAQNAARMFDADTSTELDALREVARLRKELVALEWKGDCRRCPSCGADSIENDDGVDEGTHREGCIFTTIPRPKR